LPSRIISCVLRSSSNASCRISLGGALNSTVSVQFDYSPGLLTFQGLPEALQVKEVKF